MIIVIIASIVLADIVMLLTCIGGSRGEEDEE